VAVVLARELDVEPGQRPRFYVLHVERARCEVSEWAQRMAALRVRFPAAPLYMRTGGQEAALLDTMRLAHGLTVSHEPTRGDKRQNALALADEWREGRVLVPESASWDVSGFLGRVLDFSGQAASEVDDEIDALVTAHQKLMVSVEMSGPAYVPAGRVPMARGGLF
jgi:phage terminase large subunit-like protein